MPLIISDPGIGNIPQVRMHVIPNGGGLSIKQRDPALSFLFLDPIDCSKLNPEVPFSSPLDRLVVSSGTEQQREYHVVTICNGQHRRAWSALLERKIAVMILNDQPPTVDIYRLEPNKIPSQELLSSSVRAVLLSYSDNPPYFKPSGYNSKRECGGNFRFEANVRNIIEIDNPEPDDFVVYSQRYQTRDADCCFTRDTSQDITKQFQPPNWVIR